MLYGTAEIFDLEDHLDRSVDVTPKCNVKVRPSAQQEPNIEGKSFFHTLNPYKALILFLTRNEIGRTLILMLPVDYF